MKEEITLLLVTDDPYFGDLIAGTVGSVYHVVPAVGNVKQTVTLLAQSRPDLVLLCYEDVDRSERFFLDFEQQVPAEFADSYQVLLLCYRGQDAKATQMCLRRGFVNYVIVGPSLDVQRLHFALRQAAHAKTAAREHDELRSKWERANAVFDELLALQRTANAIAQQARTEAAASPQVLSGALDQILEKVRATADSGRRARAPDGMSILIVDDDPLLRDICTTYLEDEGHRVLEAGDAEQCLDALERDRVDLILMDVMMPGVDGIAAIRKVRAIDRYRAIPIVMLTGHSDPETVKTCRAAGAVDFVVKPVDQKKLCEKIHKHAPTAIGGTADRSGHRAAGALARNRALPSWVKT